MLRVKGTGHCPWPVAPLVLVWVKRLALRADIDLEKILVEVRVWATGPALC